MTRCCPVQTSSFKILEGLSRISCFLLQEKGRQWTLGQDTGVSHVTGFSSKLGLHRNVKGCVAHTCRHACLKLLLLQILLFVIFAWNKSTKPLFYFVWKWYIYGSCRKRLNLLWNDSSRNMIKKNYFHKLARRGDIQADTLIGVKFRESWNWNAAQLCR